MSGNEAVEDRVGSGGIMSRLPLVGEVIAWATAWGWEGAVAIGADGR